MREAAGEHTLSCSCRCPSRLPSNQAAAPVNRRSETSALIQSLEEGDNMPRSFLVKKQHSSRRPNYGTLDFMTKETPSEDSLLHSDMPSLHHYPHMAPQLQRLSCSCSLCLRAERAQLPSPSNSLPLSILGHHSEAYSKSPAEACEVAESCTKVDLEIQHVTVDHRRKQQFLPQHPPLLALCPAITSSSCSQESFECLDCHEDHLHFSDLTKYKQLQCQWSSKKYFSCKYCEKEYVSLGALKMHIRTHTLPCVCPLCGKAFSRPWLLQGHIRTHTGEKPFSCLHCNRAFADRSNLRAHLQTHSDVKKYQCASCFKTFSRISLLAKHREAGCCLS